MRRVRPLSWILAAALLVGSAAPAAAAFQVRAPDANGCAAAIAAIEPTSGLPSGLLGAIGQVESGRRQTGGGGTAAWPWTVDVEGAGAFFDTEAEAIAAVRAAQRDGARSIDVGCMQISLLHHPEAFASLEQAFDPRSNVAFAARLLRDLHAQTGDWARAAALYHSATPALGAEYQRKVMAAWSGGAAATALSSQGFRHAPVVSGIITSPFGTAGGLSALRGRPVERAAFQQLAGSGGRGLAAYRALPIRPVLPLTPHRLLIHR